jgi:hypothetical protein
MAYKMKGSPFQRNFGIGSPLKQDLPKDFNIKGDSWKVKTPGYKDTKAGKTQAFREAGEKIKTVKSRTSGFDKWAKKVGKVGGRALGVLGMVLGSTETSKADQPNFPKESVHYRDPKKKIKFGE